MSQPSSLTLIPAENAALSDEITRLAGHINAAQHRFLTLLAALIERNAWEGAGIKSPAHWLHYLCGIDLGAAREKVRVAKSFVDTARHRRCFPLRHDQLLQSARHDAFRNAGK